MATASLFAFGLLAWSTTGVAAPDATLPPDCGSAEEFEREVQRRLGRESVLPTTSLQIVPEGSGYRLRMSVGAEQRELEDADCRELFRAAVVVAVAITLSQSAQPAPQESRRAATPNTPARAAEPSASQASNVELDLALGAGFVLGLLPKPALAFELQGKSIFHDRVGVALAGRYLAARSGDDDAQGRGLTVDGAGGQLLGLYRPNGLLEAGLGASVYRLAGKGRGTGARPDEAWAAGPSASLSFLPLRSGAFWLGLAGELHWNVLRPRFEFSNYGPIFTASRFNFSLFLLVGPRFH